MRGRYDALRGYESMDSRVYVVSSDAFARTALVRRVAFRKGSRGGFGYHDCHWCGSKTDTVTLYQYGTQREDRPGRIDWQGWAFCSVGCMRAYYE